MSESQIVGCEADGCPVLESGRCLEGFENPTECPHATRRTPQEDQEPEPESESTTELTEDGEKEPSQNAIELGGGESLTLPQSDRLANRHGGRVVLVAGEFQSGKTTLVAELYGRFLKGPYGDWSFAGSDCLRALDDRYHGTRESSGLTHPDVPRTEDEEMRLVDLRIHRDGKRLPLMLSDIRGELFDGIVGGGPVAKVVPLAARADRLMILIDGEQVANDFKRSVVLTWSKQLIGGLTEAGGIDTGTPTAIVLSKADLVDDEHSQWFAEEAEDLRQLALERGCGPTEIFMVAARPDASPHEPIDLHPLFEWLTAGSAEVAEMPINDKDVGRSFWRWGMR
jgi:hypothetical protein